MGLSQARQRGHVDIRGARLLDPIESEERNESPPTSRPMGVSIDSKKHWGHCHITLSEDANSDGTGSLKVAFNRRRLGTGEVNRGSESSLGCMSSRSTGSDLDLRNWPLILSARLERRCKRVLFCATVGPSVSAPTGTGIVDV